MGGAVGADTGVLESRAAGLVLWLMRLAAMCRMRDLQIRGRFPTPDLVAMCSELRLRGHSARWSERTER